MTDNVTAKTRDAITRFERAAEAVKRCEAELNRANTELSNAQNDAGNWLTPDDSKKGEVFHVWYGDGLLSVTDEGESSYSLKWRKKPTPKL